MRNTGITLDFKCGTMTVPLRVQYAEEGDQLYVYVDFGLLYHIEVMCTNCSKKFSIKKVRHTLLPCNICGEGKGSADNFMYTHTYGEQHANDSNKAQ